MTAALAGVVARRDLLRNLIKAQLSSRYRTTSLGLLWFILTPLLWALILTLVFQYLLRLDIPNYPIFVLSALLPWTFFQGAVSSATTSVSKSTGLVKRVRIPRIYLPMSEVITTLVHFLASLVVLFALMLVAGIGVTGAIVLLPFIVVIETVCALGFGLIGASLNVFYRDVEFLLTTALRALFYLTPSFYPLSYVPEQWRPVYLLNPMAGIIDSYREIVVYGHAPSLLVLGEATLMSMLFLVIGVVLFVRAEPSFEDHI
ncbi:MAG: ABC transporter permease [Candidatus Limnocylindrales bacterium]